ncbi:MAG: SDR family oxidoreductase, partial [Bacteroidota bacterium]
LVPELSPYGITINAVAPGATLTERTLEHEHYQTEWEDVTPNRKVSTTLDIAEGVLFLLSDQAKHINGQTITIDGGWTGLSPNPESFKSI